MTTHRNKKLSNGRVLAALRKHGGIVSMAAAELRVSRQAISYRVRASEELRAAVAELEDEVLDLGESMIIKAIRRGDVSAAKWLLERKGRARGYGTRQETETRIPDDQLEAIVASIGGDPARLRAVRNLLASDTGAKN